MPFKLAARLGSPGEHARGEADRLEPQRRCARHLRPGSRRPRGDRAPAARRSPSRRPGGAQLPSVSIGGASGQELPTALGTAVRFRAAAWSTRCSAQCRRRRPRPLRAACRCRSAPVEVRGLVKRYGDADRRRRRRPDRRARRRVRLPRPERRRQDHVAADDARADPPDGGRGPAVRPRPAREASRALDGVAGFVEAPRFYPYLSGRENLELLAALDGGDAAARIDEALDIVELTDRGERPGRRLLARHAPAARDRRGAAARPAAAAARRARHRARPGRHARHARAVAGSPTEGITVLLSSHLLTEVEELCNRVAIVRAGAIVYEGALAELQARRPAAATGCARPTTTRAAGGRAARSRASRTCARSTRGAALRAPTRTAVAELSIALVEAGAAIRALAPRDARRWRTCSSGSPRATSRGADAAPSRRAAEARRDESRRRARSTAGSCASCAPRSAPTSASAPRSLCRSSSSSRSRCSGGGPNDVAVRPLRPRDRPGDPARAPASSARSGCSR